MKRFFALLTAMTLLFAAGCSAGGDKDKTDGDASTVTGTLEQVKDFMFILTDDQGNSYTFAADDETPTLLGDAKEGDKVVVTYKGELSEVDAFQGEVISVEPAK